MKMLEDLKLKVLLEEYKLTNERVENFLSSQSKFYFQGILIVFGLLGVFRDYKEVLLGLPLIIIIYVGLFLYHYKRCLTNQEYKRHLEIKINEISGENLIFYTQLGYDKVEKNNKFIRFNIFSYLILIAISITAFVIYFTGTTASVNRYFIIITALILILLLGMLVLAIRDIPKQLKTIKESIIPGLANAINEDIDQK